MDVGALDLRIQILAVAVTALIFLVILELVRRRRLVERYALLWLLAAVALVTLAVWRDLLDIAAELIGVAYPPNALFLIALGVVFVLLLHFSVATSRLSEETKILAQEVARLDAELRAARRLAPNGDRDGGDRTQRPAPEGDPKPSRARTTDQ